MPRRDGTGPMGYGPQTGRGFGLCQRGFGRGPGMGFGRRFGMGRGFYNEPVQLTKEEQKRILEAELKNIEDEKQSIQKKLKEMGE